MPIIGVSIPVPEPDGSRLQAYRVALGETRAAGVPTHITLLPPHPVGDASLPVVCAHLAGGAAATVPFRIHLRGTGTFRPVSPVVFIGVVEGISGCEQLAGRIRTGPLATELNFPYHPHVTVAHDLGDRVLDRAFTELAGFDLVFEATAFHLYTHDDDDGWRAVHRFPLGRQADQCHSPSS